MPSPKRFIAGAVCPRCAEMDKIKMHTTDEGNQVRECVACGFSDAVSEQKEPQVPELETRVNKRTNTDDHTVQQVVFFKAGQED
ncbi:MULTISPECIES: YheV family putative zinc ribbon protein [Marinobacter]|uniref:YheV family putative zinc ribbon protein n=1 Tax=Marinobacter suaedae TaxID=3057675 RepID=A0ABT8VZR6_9GAMM|nr:MULTISPECIES: YheV family putative zinc ribbon protein [unclassified Marinobacter]MBZ2169585.1 YheV family putative metal-binding protein [Marinobacter sp. F4216]MDO3721418.1 YheV family putative zinc ribbon protein [Marinobacter sp. chi1]